MLFRNIIIGIILALTLNSCAVGIGIPIGRFGSIGIDTNGNVDVGIGVPGIGVGIPVGHI